MPNGATKVTVWNNINPKAFLQTSTRKLYLGQAGFIGLYSTYLDNTAEYRLSYYTSWIDFGNPIQESILKRIILTVIGGADQTIIFKWAHDFTTTYFSGSAILVGATSPSEYGIAEYGIGEYSGDSSVTNILSVSGSGKGAVIQFGFEVQINGKEISIQKLSIYSKESKLP
jgi:hypothetical protein